MLSVTDTSEPRLHCRGRCGQRRVRLRHLREAVGHRPNGLRTSLRAPALVFRDHALRQSAQRCCASEGRANPHGLDPGLACPATGPALSHSQPMVPWRASCPQVHRLRPAPVEQASRRRCAGGRTPRRVADRPAQLPGQAHRHQRGSRSLAAEPDRSRHGPRRRCSGISRHRCPKPIPETPKEAEIQPTRVSRLATIVPKQTL